MNMLMSVFLGELKLMTLIVKNKIVLFRKNDSSTKSSV